jgi:hypothetical protein
MIQLRCACGKVLQTQDEFAGRQLACPGCGSAVIVPPSQHAVQAPPLPPHALAERPPRPRPGARGGAVAGRAEAPASGSSGKAIIALILGIGTFLLPVLLAVPAVVLALLALGEIRRGGGRLGGRGMAVAGLVTGCVGNITILPYLWLFWGVQSQVEDDRARITTRNNLKQIGFAFHTYNDAFQKLPASSYGPGGRPLLSWRVHILPFVEEEALYRQFKLDEPWDSPHNKPLLARMPKIYATVKGATREPHSTCYQVFTGPGTPYRSVQDTPRIPASFPDGTSNTFLVVETVEAVPWTKPEDVRLAPNQPLPRLGGVWKDGFFVAMADGSVQFVDSRRVSEPTLRALIDPMDGRVIPDDWRGEKERHRWDHDH